MTSTRKVVRRRHRSSNTKISGEKSSPTAESIFVDWITLRTNFPSPNGVFDENFGPGDEVPTRNHGCRWKRNLKLPNGAKIHANVVESGETAQEVAETALKQHRQVQIATLSFNPSRIAYPEHGTGNVTLDQLPQVLDLIVKFLASIGIPGVSFEWATLQRLDLARDFELDGIPVASIINPLYQFERKNKPRVKLERTGPESETLYVGWPTTRMSKLYNQTAKYGEEFPTDLRFETEFRYKALARVGLRYVSDIWRYRETSLDLLMESWGLARFAETIAPRDSVVERLQAFGLNGKELGNTIGYFRLRKAGLTEGYSKDLRRKYEECLTQAGCQAISDSFSCPGNLDIASGKFVSE